ncbi:MAG TPA: SET domain-containing protein [Candidatus Paceibacterota bacterium]
MKHAYLNPKTSRYVLCFDDARFFSHSDNHNCIDTISINDKEGIDVAIKDIRKGEELTNNYRKFDSDFDYKMNI